MYDALYSRQSIEKADSISIESQLEYCRYETHGNPYKEYIDRGYSGKDTNRPAFEELLKDVKRGRIQRVIVYKLDRISRSILDFANMMDIFQKYHVEFVSSTERFDTSTPIGRAMLSICIVFAQLERETIQKRVTDAYYSRCRRGLYMGGRVPYGFVKTDTIIDGVKTSMYMPAPKEAEQICLMYALYADPENSLGDIIKYFHEHGIRHLRGGVWSTARISEMLRNPIYVRADAEVYGFFKEQGADVISPVSDFTGCNACYLYKGPAARTGRRSDLTDKEVVLAPHEGIVSSADWVKCRLRCLGNRQSTRTNKAKNSWLAGKVKCGKCDCSLIVAKANTKRHRYFICGTASATKKAKCQGTGDTVYAEVLEEYVQNAIGSRLAEFQMLSKREKNDMDPRINENKLRIVEINEEIEALLAGMTGANTVLLDYINQKAGALDAEKRRLQEENAVISQRQSGSPAQSIRDHVLRWEKAAFEDRQAVADIFIKVITIADGVIEITWNI
ncbi:MAG: recombinase family protein [Clostridiales bacterium]|nr:recombinase family protein [Clostridiales bacterium]